MKRVPVVLALVLLCAASAFGDCGTLTNITEAVPTLHVGEIVHFNFEFIGGTEPYHFAFVDGALPPGVNLTGAGGLRGKPTQAGSFDAFIQVTDAAGCTLTARGPSPAPRRPPAPPIPGWIAGRGRSGPSPTQNPRPGRPPLELQHV